MLTAASDCCYGRVGKRLPCCGKSRCRLTPQTGFVRSRKSAVKWSSMLNKSANSRHGIRQDIMFGCAEHAARIVTCSFSGSRQSSWSRDHIRRVDPSCTCSMAHIRRQGHVRYHVVSHFLPACKALSRNVILLLLWTVSIIGAGSGFSTEPITTEKLFWYTHSRLAAPSLDMHLFFTQTACIPAVAVWPCTAF